MVNVYLNSRTTFFRVLLNPGDWTPEHENEQVDRRHEPTSQVQVHPLLGTQAAPPVDLACALLEDHSLSFGPSYLQSSHRDFLDSVSSNALATQVDCANLLISSKHDELIFILVTSGDRILSDDKSRSPLKP